LPTATADDAYFGDSSVTFEPEVALSKTVGRVRLAANLGLRFREESKLANLTVDDEMFARGGIGYRFARRPLELDATISAASALQSPLDQFNQNHLEVLGGGSYVAGPLVVFAAAGAGIKNGFGTPDWRALAGVRFGEGHAIEGDRDRDGLLDAVDRCPDEPEDQDGFQDRDGCPDPDNDADGVLDVNDGAPMEPEDQDGFQDDDGVPDPDNDRDRVADGEDACPLEPGLTDHRGCPRNDADGDGVFDDADRCPAEAEDLDGFSDADGCPDADNDEDGVLDSADRCPLEPGPAANAGCPDVDGDGDTVVDRLDNCPTEKGAVANRGCAAKQLVQINDGKLDIIEPVYFRTNKDVIQSRSYKLLDNVAAVLNAQTKLQVRVEGHTDDVGNDAYNKDLSRRRAAAVVRYLVGKGVDSGRLSSAGYGEERPIASNKSKAGRAANRRVAFVIVSGAEGEIQVEQNGPTNDTIDK
jgi:outer membrane protein OmpA-like peptidoglycan-associated protein